MAFISKFHKVIYLFGAYSLGKPFYDFMEHYCNNYHRGLKLNISNEQRIQSTWNPSGNKWAIITGGSEGIGRSFALDLAKSGFNILIASRTLSKLQKVEKELKETNPNIKVKCVPIDLANTIDYSTITKDTEVMDNLGILVNNAG